jgi:hypothetical protein
MLLTLTLNTYAQEEENRNSSWGKLALGQNSPNPVVSGEPTTIRYKANDVNNVMIILYDKNGKKVFTFDDLFPGEGQVWICKRLDPGHFSYALFANGRMVEKKSLEVVEPTSAINPPAVSSH